MKYQGFNKEEFLRYMAREFSLNHFSFDLIDNIIDYGLEHQSASKDQLCYWLMDMIPEVTFGEITEFMDDDCLTDIGKKMKANYQHRKTARTSSSKK